MDPAITAHPTQLAFAAACADVHRTDLASLGVAGAARSGVAYLVRPDCAVTAASVVRGMALGQALVLRFSSGEHRARLLRVDPEADCALLRIDPAVRNQIPMSFLSGPVQPGTHWQTWIATPTLRSPGHVVQGLVHQPIGEDELRGPALLLKTVSGTNWWQPNQAGSPVLYGGRVIGHLRQVRSDPQSQSLCACPLLHVQSLLLLPGDGSFLQPPKAQYTRPFYISRPSVEQPALTLLEQPGQPVVLWAPERHGKTWLLDYLCEQLAQDEQSFVLRINCERLPSESYASLETFLQELIGQFTAQFQALPDVGRDLTTAALRACRLAASPELRLDEVLATVFLPRTPQLLYLAFDRVDAIKDLMFQDTFLALLRGWLSRKDVAPWNKLRLLLVTSMAPMWMTKLPAKSPFTVVPPLVIPDFSLQQLEELAHLHDLPWQQAELTQLMSLLGGHPYLTRLAMYSAVAKGYSVEQIISPERPGVQVFDNFLETCRQRLLVQPGLWPTAERALQGKPLSALDRVVLPRLERLGLVRLNSGDGDSCEARYPLYKRLLLD